MATQYVVLSIHPCCPSPAHSSDAEDWDRSMNLDTRNSVAFPADAHPVEETAHEGAGRDKRTISELLKLHSEKGKDVTFSAEEAGRIAEVLGQWVSRLTTFLILQSSSACFLSLRRESMHALCRLRASGGPLPIGGHA